jgi:hypothetical protein
MPANQATSKAVAGLRQFFIILMSPDDFDREVIVGFFVALSNCGYHVSASPGFGRCYLYVRKQTDPLAACA